VGPCLMRRGWGKNTGGGGGEGVGKGMGRELGGMYSPPPPVLVVFEPIDVPHTCSRGQLSSTSCPRARSRVVFGAHTWVPLLLVSCRLPVLEPFGLIISPPSYSPISSSCVRALRRLCPRISSFVFDCWSWLGLVAHNSRPFVSYSQWACGDRGGP